MTVATIPSILIGLIGSGIGESLSPAMHEREGRLQGMSYVYRLIDLEVHGLSSADLPDLLPAAERLGFTGLNITHPLKDEVIGLLDELSDVAERIGAVNTVVFRDGKRLGYNTDAWGFAESFREQIAGRCRYDTVLLLGAGGAGKAVAFALLEEFDCRVEIFDKRVEMAQEVATMLAGVYGRDRVRFAGSVSDSITCCDGVVNATPVGMRQKFGTPFDVALLESRMWVADIVYFPMNTALVVAAEAAGCTVMRGGGMAVYQAAQAFKRFTGVQPDAGRMKAHFADLTSVHRNYRGSA